MSRRYKIKTVSELSGFSPTLLRAWESRHGLLEPIRQPSGHRLYTDEDVQVLHRVRQLLSQGQTIGEIAASGRPSLLGDFPVAGAEQSSLAPPRRVGTSPLLALQKEILEAAVALDQPRVRRALGGLEELLSRREMAHMIPAALLREMGSMCTSGDADVASEHFLSAILGDWVRRVIADIGPGRSEEPILCAGFPDEQHDLGLWVVAYELRHGGRQVVCLGGGLPFIDLERAIAKTRPAVVCLTVTRQVVFDVHRPRFGEVVGRHPGVRFLVGGGGIAHAEGDLLSLGATPWSPYRRLEELGQVLG